MFRFIVSNESYVNLQRPAGNLVNVTVFKCVHTDNFGLEKQCNMNSDSLPTYLARILVIITVFRHITSVNFGVIKQAKFSMCGQTKYDEKFKDYDYF
jgi:hypothetical protein